MKISPNTATKGSDAAWYIITILVIIILVSLAGYAFILQQKHFLINEKIEEISTIADLKSSQLVQWRKERFAEAASIRANTMLGRRINDYYVGTDKSEVSQEFKQWISSMVDLGEYSKGILFSPNGKVITSDTELKLPLAQHYFELVAEVVSNNEIILTTFHSDFAGDKRDINLAIPIMHFDGSISHCIAILVLDIDPAKRLYPLIQSWPTASPTAETLLVVREGDSVIFLNELRHRKTADVPFLLPITDKKIPAVLAALGIEGSFEGVDYRNIKVLSAVRVIPGTRWGLVSKVDLSEVISPLYKSIWRVIFVGVVVVTTMILGLFLWGVRKRAQTLQKLVEIEKKHNFVLQESEEYMTRSRNYHLQLLNIFPSLVWRSGIDASCDYFNLTWLAFTGRTLKQELGNGWTEGVHPDDLERCFSIYMEAFGAQRAFSMEYRLRFNDGSYHWINDHGCPYYDQEETFAGYIGCCYDINDQKNAEFELQRVHAHLEQQIFERTRDLSESNILLREEIAERKQLEEQLLRAKRLEAIGQIAGGVAHEVRNPLNAILTITEALFREKEIESNPEFEPFIQHIRSQVNRLVQLMNDLLDLGRSIPSTNMQPTPLYDVCRETLVLWKSTGMSKNKRGVLTSDSDDTSIQVLADGIKLQQVFFNLLENAGHHTPEGNKITIQLTQNCSNIARGIAVVQVIDQGAGIPEAKIRQVFDPFYTDRKGGTGLGLALVKHFIENMGGSVQIWNNDPPPGCTVEIRIPLYQEELQ